jgi:hypothetical protein
VIERLRVPVALEAEVGEIGVELTRGGVELVLDRGLEAELEETPRRREPPVSAAPKRPRPEAFRNSRRSAGRGRSQRRRIST